MELHVVLLPSNRLVKRGLRALPTVSWVHGDLGQRAPRLAEQERKREPELSQHNRLGRELHVVLLRNNKTATQMLVIRIGLKQATYGIITNVSGLAVPAK